MRYGGPASVNKGILWPEGKSYSMLEPGGVRSDALEVFAGWKKGTRE